MAGIDFSALRNTITMEEVLNKIGFEFVSRTGDQLHGPCPQGNRILSGLLDDV
jgi:hypothetical protein